MQEQTLLLIKPNAVEQKNIGDILRLVEQNGFDIVTLEMMKVEKDFIETFYRVHTHKPFFHHLIDFMISGKCVVAILEKNNAVEDLRELSGDTDPALAFEGTIRRLYGLDVTKNAVHSSDSPENAKREIKLLFPSA